MKFHECFCSVGEYFRENYSFRRQLGLLTVPTAEQLPEILIRLGFKNLNFIGDFVVRPNDLGFVSQGKWRKI